MRTSIRTKLGLSASDSLITDTVLDSLINEAVHQFETEADWEWLETQETLNATSGNSTLTPGATHARTVSLTDIAGDTPLVERPIQELEMLTAATGIPQFYGFYAGLLEIRPKANGSYSYRHKFVRFEPDLVSGTDTPLAPSTYHYAYVEYASALVHRRLQDERKAAQCMAAYNSWVERARRRSNLMSPSHGGGINGTGVGGE
jgi:hypothetical protein